MLWAVCYFIDRDILVWAVTLESWVGARWVVEKVLLEKCHVVHGSVSHWVALAVLTMAALGYLRWLLRTPLR